MDSRRVFTSLDELYGHIGDVELKLLRSFNYDNEYSGKFPKGTDAVDSLKKSISDRLVGAALLDSTEGKDIFAIIRDRTDHIVDEGIRTLSSSGRYVPGFDLPVYATIHTKAIVEYYKISV